LRFEQSDQPGALHPDTRTNAGSLRDQQLLMTMAGASPPWQHPGPPGSWRSQLTPQLGAAATAVAMNVTARLRLPDRIAQAAAAAMAQTAFPQCGYWVPYGLADGDAGLAVMSAQLDRCCPDEDWDITGHHQLTVAARAIERSGCLNPGLFAGWSGLAFAALALSRGGTRYGRLRAMLDSVLAPKIDVLVAESLARRNGMSVGTFDLISGLTGIGAYLLARGEPEGEFDALAAVIDALMTITGGEDALPRWYTPPELVGDPAQLHLQPHGSLNCGLAHGIPGPLSLMALAISAGLTLPRLDERVRQLADWLIAHQLDGKRGITWPSMIPLDSRGRTLSALPSRTAWCYGAPGVARSLWLAGTALGDDRFCQIAVEAMKVVYRTPRADQAIDSPTLCHGAAGLLQITLRFAHDTRDPVFTESAQHLVERILAANEPDTIVALRDVEPDGRKVDRAGLLTGAGGVALALLAAATNVEPTWDRAFLLA
jgi:class I lanthipeptide synthase